MNNDKNMDVVDWRDSAPPIIVRTRAPRRFLSPSGLGIIGTVLIHALIVPSAYLGSRAAKSRPPEMLETGALASSKSDSEESLVLISFPTLSRSNQQTFQSAASLPALANRPVKLPVQVDPPALLSIEVLTLGEEQAARATAAVGDGTEQARLFGIYTGQIKARIDRVWRRPRTPVNDRGAGEALTATDDSFQCEAQIVQDLRGNVQEVLLPRCNGSLTWQRSLVLAIQQASPLPAPPSATVFSPSITLSFVGLPYVPGSSDEDYEFAPEVLARSTSK
jgi:hypothetical protein